NDGGLDRRELLRRRNEVVPARDREADAVNSDRPFPHNVAGKILRYAYAIPPVFPFRRQVRHPSDGVHVSQDKVAAEFLTGCKRLLEIDARANAKADAFG